MIRVGGLWKHDSKSGKMLTGNAGQLRIIILPNSRKEKPTQPDFFLYVDQQQPKDKAKSDNSDDFMDQSPGHISNIADGGMDYDEADN